MYMLTGEHTGIYFVDSTKLAICPNKRTSNNRVFSRLAKGGVSSYGYFLGFKLHLIINNKGEIMAIKLLKWVNYLPIKAIFPKKFLMTYLRKTYDYLPVSETI